MKIKELAKSIKERLETDKDLVVAITGNEGDGKSALAIDLGNQGDPNFNLDLNELYSPNAEEMEKKVTTLPKYSYIIADEAIKSLYKLNWATRGQRYLNELYAICRKENKCSILCIPRFSDLNEFFRNHRVKLWLHIIDPISNKKNTGQAVVFAPSWSPFVHDPWWFKVNQKLIDEYSHKHRIKEVDYVLDDKIDLLSTSRNFVGVINFNWVDKELWDKYLENKNSTNTTVLFKESLEPVSELNKRISDRLKIASKALKEKGLNENDLADLFKVPKTTVRNYLR
jgi:hypothetical protein